MPAAGREHSGARGGERLQRQKVLTVGLERGWHVSHAPDCPQLALGPVTMPSPPGAGDHRRAWHRGTTRSTVCLADWRMPGEAEHGHGGAFEAKQVWAKMARACIWMWSRG